MRRSRALRVLEPLTLPADFEFLPGVPAKLSDCERGPRPCPYIKCPKHLWLSLKEDQRGNPQKGRQGATTIRPITMQTCQRDVTRANPHGLPPAEVGELLGIDARRVLQIEATALAKLELMGVDLRTFLES